MQFISCFCPCWHRKSSWKFKLLAWSFHPSRPGQMLLLLPDVGYCMDVPVQHVLPVLCISSTLLLKRNWNWKVLQMWLASVTCFRSVSFQYRTSSSFKLVEKDEKDRHKIINGSVVPLFSSVCEASEGSFCPGIGLNFFQLENNCFCLL